MQATGHHRIVRPPRPPRPVKPSTAAAPVPAPAMSLPRPQDHAPRPQVSDQMDPLSQLEQRRETRTIEYDEEGRRIMTEPLPSHPRLAPTVLHPPGSGKPTPALPVRPPLVWGQLPSRPPLPPAPSHLTPEQRAAWCAEQEAKINAMLAQREADKAAAEKAEAEKRAAQRAAWQQRVSSTIPRSRPNTATKKPQPLLTPDDIPF